MDSSYDHITTGMEHVVSPHDEPVCHIVQPSSPTIYVSLVPDLEAWAEDAMSVSWGNLLFPPLPILGRDIRKA